MVSVWTVGSHEIKRRLGKSRVDNGEINDSEMYRRTHAEMRKEDLSHKRKDLPTKMKMKIQRGWWWLKDKVHQLFVCPLFCNPRGRSELVSSDLSHH